MIGQAGTHAVETVELPGKGAGRGGKGAFTCFCRHFQDVLFRSKATVLIKIEVNQYVKQFKKSKQYQQVVPRSSWLLRGNVQ